MFSADVRATHRTPLGEGGGGRARRGRRRAHLHLPAADPSAAQLRRLQPVPGVRRLRAAVQSARGGAAQRGGTGRPSLGAAGGGCGCSMGWNAPILFSIQNLILLVANFDIRERKSQHL